MARRVMLAVACLALLAVPLALPSGSSTIHPSLTAHGPTTSPPSQLVADRVGTHVVATTRTAPRASSARSSASGRRLSGTRVALSHAQWVAAVRYQAWVRSIAYQSRLREAHYAAWQREVRYQRWRVAVASEARTKATARHHATSPVTLRPPSRIHGFRVGVATWYAWHPGQCASSYRPKGSRIWITDIATGKTISCVVTDSQPYSPNRVVDLNETQFAELAPLWRGVVRVRVTW